MARAAAVVDGVPDACERCVDSTLRPNRTFAVSPRHAGTYSGGPRQRDAVYDEGTARTWLLRTSALQFPRGADKTNDARVGTAERALRGEITAI